MQNGGETSTWGQFTFLMRSTKLRSQSWLLEWLNQTRRPKMGAQAEHPLMGWYQIPHISNEKRVDSEMRQGCLQGYWPVHVLHDEPRKCRYYWWLFHNRTSCDSHGMTHRPWNKKSNKDSRMARCVQLIWSSLKSRMELERKNQAAYTYHCIIRLSTQNGAGEKGALSPVQRWFPLQ